ncbi:MAG: hypothetical protein ABIG95_03765 [Candidatus Woesearchaeota archaeon]
MKTQKRLKEMEAKIKEEEGLWKKIKKIPKEDKKFLRILKSPRAKRIKRPNLPKQLKDKIMRLMKGIEPR